MSPPRVQALSEGELGVCLLHIERGEFPQARCCLTEAVAAGVSVGGNASLFHGAPALEFVLGCAGRAERRVQDAVDGLVSKRLAAAHRRRDCGALPPLAEFDLIRGLSGLGALLLSRRGHTPLLADVLAYLVGLAHPVRVGGCWLPGWWSEAGPDGKTLAGGHGNNGVAHGIAGPLALLSIASRAGLAVDGQAAAIEVFARWLEEHGGFYWVTRDQLDTADAAPPARPSWCYGAIGIARARQLAGLATGDPSRCYSAERAALTALTDPARIDRTVDAGLCHGWAGLLTVTRAIAADSRTPDLFEDPINDLTARLATGLDELAKPGFLEGRAGARLALDGTNATGWTRALLID